MFLKHINTNIFRAALLGLMSLFFVQQSYAEESVDTITPGVLLIGSDLTYPPYLYLKDGKAVGFDPDFMRAVAEHMGLEPKFVDTRFAQLIIGLRSQRFDVVASILYITPKRAEAIDYVPYMQTGDSLIVQADGDFEPQTAKDLCGKSVSNIKGASWIPKLKKVTQEHCLPADKQPIEIKVFPTAPGATQALLSGNVDAQFADAAVAKLAVEKSAGQIKITSDELLFPIAVGLGVNASNDDMCAALTQAIEEMKSTGEYQKLLDKYNLRPFDEAQVREVLADSQ